MDRIANFEKMLATGSDNAMLRYSLGNEYLAAEQPEAAVAHLKECLRHDPGYSAAWKLLGKALNELDDREQARFAWEQGIAAAEAGGDEQARKEMQVFLKRLAKQD